MRNPRTEMYKIVNDVPFLQHSPDVVSRLDAALHHFELDAMHRAAERLRVMQTMTQAEADASPFDTDPVAWDVRNEDADALDPYVKTTGHHDPTEQCTTFCCGPMHWHLKV